MAQGQTLDFIFTGTRLRSLTLICSLNHMPMEESPHSMSRITCPILSSKITSAEEAASHINDGDRVGMSGFTGAGYPKAVPGALAERAKDHHQRGDEFGVELWTGASTAPELDGVLAEVGALRRRLPFQSDPTLRKAINSGQTEYIDTHLSHSAQQAWFGFYGNLDVAVVEVAAVLPNGLLVPSSSVGNSKTWLDTADKVIIEVNEWHPHAYEGFHDVYYGTRLPPERRPLQLLDPMQRIGDPYLRVDSDKVIAIVETEAPDRNLPFKDADESSKAMADHVVDFLRHEINHDRLPENLLPLQSGVGNVANAVMTNLAHSEFENLTAYTEVIQDGMVEADIYGNVNSTHVMGSSIINGIGGSGDFARNAYLNFFVSPSVAKDGAISSIVPFASHIDHTEHDTQILVTEQGLADLRGLSPTARAEKIIHSCAHPDYRDRLQDLSLIHI